MMLRISRNIVKNPTFGISKRFISIGDEVTEFQLSRLRSDFHNYKNKTNQKINELEWKIEDLETRFETVVQSKELELVPFSVKKDKKECV